MERDTSTSTDKGAEIDGQGQKDIQKEHENLDEYADGSSTVEDLLTTLMRQLKGSKWLKEAADAASSSSSSVDQEGVLNEIKDAIAKQVEVEVEEKEKEKK
jgi:hypothetical protein